MEVTRQEIKPRDALGFVTRLGYEVNDLFYSGVFEDRDAMALCRDKVSCFLDQMPNHNKMDDPRLAEYWRSVYEILNSLWFELRLDKEMLNPGEFSCRFIDMQATYKGIFSIVREDIRRALQELEGKFIKGKIHKKLTKVFAIIKKYATLYFSKQNK